MLTKVLQKNLGPAWTRIDRDDLIEHGLATDGSVDDREGFDYRFDSSQISVEDEVKTIKTFLLADPKPNLYLRYVAVALVWFFSCLDLA